MVNLTSQQKRFKNCIQRNIERINRKNFILWLVATFLTFILEFLTIYSMKINMNGISLIVFFILPIVFTHLLAQQYKDIGKGIIYDILKTLEKISLLVPSSILISLLIYLFTKWELIMLIMASISIILPIIIITTDIIIVSCFDMYTKDKPKTI